MKWIKLRYNILEKQKRNESDIQECNVVDFVYLI